MELGFNTNFRHRGVLFHVQTEDSGLENPHVITHLFHGGNILASEKREYSELLGRDSLADDVRGLMEGQHKAMLKRLSRGEHDAVIRQRLGADVFGDSQDDGALNGADQSGERTDHDLGAPAAAAPPAVAPRPVPSAAGDETPKEQLQRAFGEGVVSKKALDEVVLDFLVDSARKRKRKRKPEP